MNNVWHNDSNEKEHHRDDAYIAAAVQNGAARNPVERPVRLRL